MQQLAANVRLLDPEDAHSMPWKNGGGTTHELAVFPADAGLGGKPFQWRISIAEVAGDGPFSTFPGYDRSIMLVEGRGMELSLQNGRSELVARPYRPFRFSGDVATRCRLLDGPVRDFNVISARDHIEHHCDIITGRASSAHWRRSDSLFAHCLDGTLIVKLRGVAECSLAAGQSLWFMAGAEFESAQVMLAPNTPQTVAALVTLRQLQGSGVPAES